MLSARVDSRTAPEAVNEEDRWRAERAAREWKQWLDRNPHVLDAIAQAQSGLQAMGKTLQNFTATYTKSIDTLVESMGGFENIRAMMQVAAGAITRLVQALPPNWPLQIDYEKAIDLANDGVPVMWVPPKDVVTELVAASDRNAQLAILHAHAGELRDDIVRTLDEVTHASLAGQVALARRAVEAWSAGHCEAAQALAVAVTETVITTHYAEGRGYTAVSKAAKIADDFDEIAISELRLAVAVAPISVFYTEWRPSWGTPPPDALSRHVTVHHADPGHYSVDNALIAMLLQTSVLRAFHETLVVGDAADGEQC